MRGPCPSALLERALTASARAHRVVIAVATTQADRWESATFSGARHRVTLCADDGAALADWLAALPELDLPLRGQLVADLAIVERYVAGGAMHITIDALTVET